MKKIIVILLALVTSSFAQDEPKVLEYFWQYDAGRLDIVLVPKAWPKDCHGFHIEVAHLETGKTTKMNRAPMMLAKPAQRDMSDFIDDPELAKSISELGAKTVKETKALKHSPDALHSFGGRIRLSLRGIIFDDPLMMYYCGLRVSHKMPAGKYKITIGVEDGAGVKSEVFSGAFDTAAPPKPVSDPEFSVKPQRKGSMTIDWEFKDPYYKENIPFWLFCGVERDTKHVNTFGDHASMSAIFKKGSISNKIGAADPEQYTFGIQTTDWFGNKQVYLKKEVSSKPVVYPEISFGRISQGTNGVINISWKAMSAIAGAEGLSVNLNRYHADGSLAVNVASQSILESNFVDVVHAHTKTSLVYEVTLLDGTEAVRSSRITYPHDGLSRPAKCEILNVSTTSVDGVRSLVIEVSKSPWVKHSAFTLAERWKPGYEPMTDGDYQHLTNTTIVLGKDFITRRPEFQLMVREEAQQTPGSRYHLPGEWSDWVSLQKPPRRGTFSSSVAKHDSLARIKCTVPSDGSHLTVFVDGCEPQTLTNSVPAGEWFEFDTLNLATSDWHSVAHYDDGFVVTSKVERTRNTYSRNPLLAEAREKDGRLHLTFDLRDGVQKHYRGMFLTINGRPVRRFSKDEVAQRMTAELKTEQLSDGDWIQLMSSQYHSSPAYEYRKPKESD